MFDRLDHVGIVVREMEPALALYRDVCGLRLLSRERLEASGLDVAFLNGGGCALELLAPWREGSSVAKFLETRGPGMHHIAWQVRSIEEALATSVAAGLQPVGEIAIGAGGHRTAFLHPRETLGTLLELVEIDHR